MGEIHRLHPQDREFVGDAALRVGELADALRCIDKIMAPDEETVTLLTNDLRGLFKVLLREANGIGIDLGSRY